MILTDWEAIRAAGSGNVGGKAWNLARLARYGFAVPAGQAIPVAAYRQWLEGSGLEAELIAAAGVPEGERAAAIAAVTGKLAALPTNLDLSAIPACALAVRSSAPQEDSTTASFAGIHTSLLNVQGEENVDAAIRSVWLSLWTPQAVAYRERMQLAHEDAAMAVLLMPLIPARVSGIAFSRDPVSGRDDRLVIHATFGLGESLVSGQGAGDEILLAEDYLDDCLSIVKLTPGDKAVRVQPAADGGTETQTLKADHRRSLTDALALQLGEQVRLAACALDFARPDFDIEWAWDGERFWLLQARPITASKRCTYPELDAQPGIWSRGNTCEVLPEPLQAIDWFHSRRLVNLLLEQGPKLVGYPVQPGVQRAGLFDGRLYLNLSVMQWENYDGFGLPPAAMNALVGGHQPEIEVPPLSLRQRLAQARRMLYFMVASQKLRRRAEHILADEHGTAKRWRALPLSGSEDELLGLLLEQQRHIRSATGIFFLQAASGASLSTLVDLIDKRLPGEGHALAAALLAGGEASVTAQQGYAMVDLALIAAGDATARAWLLEHADDDWQQALPASSPFRTAFADFLERFGHRGVYESYSRNPRWREEPEYLFDTIAGLMQTDLDALHRRQRLGAESAMQRLRDNTPFWLRPLLRMLIKGSITETSHREAARSALVALMEPERATLLAIAAQWQRRGLLQQCEDIFHLTPPEIADTVRGLIPAGGIAARIADRRQQFESWMSAEVPEVIIESDGFSQPHSGESPSLPADGRTFKGVAVGTGTARGPACILRSPTEGTRLNPGDVLVTPSTDPSWTPLFLKAGGLVMETGGYLSHGAIVAREFGIPAVVNLPGILGQLKDGEPLEVDGIKGVVTRLAD